MAALGYPQIDYFSLDIEGAEYAVLKTLEWQRLDILSLSVEVQHAGEIFDGTREDINNLTQTNGLEFVRKVGHDDVYVKTKLKCPLA